MECGSRGPRVSYPVTQPTTPVGLTGVVTYELYRCSELKTRQLVRAGTQYHPVIHVVTVVITGQQLV